MHGIGYTPVTHETRTTPQPAHQANAYLHDFGFSDWLISSFVAWKQTTDNVNEMFDTQQMLFAKRLVTLDLDELKASERIAHTPKNSNMVILTTMY